MIERPGMRWGLRMLSILWLAGCPRAPPLVAIPTNCILDGGPEPLNPRYSVGYPVDAGARNPANDCQACAPEANSSGWTNLDTGTPCGGDAGAMFCDSSQHCIASCVIGGVLYSPGPDPQDHCQLCIPSVSGTDWTPALCQPGSGTVCAGGSCQPGCLIDGGFVSPGAPSQGSVCVICDPDAGTTSWSWSPIGAACNGTSYCFGGNCIAGCFIGGLVYLPGQADTVGTCRACQPDAGTTTDWTRVPDGTPCKDGGTCQDGGCCSAVGGPCTSGADCCNPSLSCDAGACGCMALGDGPCFKDVECCSPATAYCDGTGCLSKIGAGKPCTTDHQCINGSCIDGGCT